MSGEFGTLRTCGVDAVLGCPGVGVHVLAPRGAGAFIPSCLCEPFWDPTWGLYNPCRQTHRQAQAGTSSWELLFILRF